MPGVAYFIYSESALNENVPMPSKPGEPTVFQQKTHIIGPQFVIRPLFVPCLYSFSISTAIQGVNPKKLNLLRVTFSYNDEPPVVDSGNIPIQFTEEQITDLPDELKGVAFNLDHRNVPFRQNGIYYSEVFLNDISLGRFPINVWRQEA